MIRVAHGDCRDAVRFGAFDGFARCQFGQHVSHAVVTVDDHDRTCIHHEFRLRHRLHHAVAQPIQVPPEAQDAVRLMSPQVCLHQRIGNETRVGLGDSGA